MLLGKGFKSVCLRTHYNAVPLGKPQNPHSNGQHDDKNYSLYHDAYLTMRWLSSFFSVSARGTARTPQPQGMISNPAFFASRSTTSAAAIASIKKSASHIRASLVTGCWSSKR